MVNRVAAVYMTVVATWLIISFANSLQKLSVNRSAAHQQYISSFVSILKIILIFVAVIIIISIIIDKDPTTLLAGLGAVSAILMLAFQDTIKGLVAGVRLASNDMLAVGDRITVPAAGADGIVEEIKLTTVKVRNFDNTIITITPQTLVDGSFQNWKGVKENVGRKAVRKVFFDFRSLTVDSDGVVNLTRYREHMEEWLAKNSKVIPENPIPQACLWSLSSGCMSRMLFPMSMIFPKSWSMPMLLPTILACVSISSFLNNEFYYNHIGLVP